MNKKYFGLIFLVGAVAGTAYQIWKETKNKTKKPNIFSTILKRQRNDQEDRPN